MAGKFVVQRSGDQFAFHLFAPNGEKILHSERYQKRGSALDGVKSVQANAADAGRFEKKTSTANQPYFVLKAKNGEIVGMSEMYSSEAARDNGISSVMANAPGASVDDRTKPATP